MQIKNLLDKIDTYRQEEIKEKQKKQNTHKTSQKDDKLSLSPKAKLFATIFQKAKNAPEIRTEKIEKIKAQIDAGEYHLDHKKIAQKIIEEDQELWI